MTTIYRNYSIVFSDASLVAGYQATYPDGVQMAPDSAATLFGAPVNSTGGPSASPPRIDLLGHSATSILSTSAASATWPVNTIVDGDGIQFAYPGGTGGTIVWVGYFIMEGVGVAATAEALQTVRWLNGFELPIAGEGGSGNAGNHCSRDASRTPEGLGFAYRSESNANRTETLPTPSQKTWERMYVRLRKKPVTNNEYFWFTNSSIEGGSTLLAAFTPAGNINFYNKGNTAFPGTLLCTVDTRFVPLNTWAKLDILISYAVSSISNGSVSVFVNGTSVAFGASSSSSGIGTVQNQTLSSLGNEGLSATGGGEIDIDDWSGASYPLYFTGLDWLNGTHIQQVMPNGFGPNHVSANWAGDAKTLEGNPVAGQPAADVVTTTVASPGVLEVATNYQDYQLGCRAFAVGFYASNSGAMTSTMGYTMNGGAAVLTSKSITQAVWTSLLVAIGASLVTPTPITSLTFQYVKTTAGTQSVQALQGVAEYIGTWGPEDSPTTAFPPRTGTHNAPYWDQASQNSFAAPTAPVCVVGGTYVGNGTGQTITVSQPIHWWWCRPLTGAVGGSHWWSSLLAGHDESDSLPTPNRFIRAERTSAGVYQVRISGANVNSNANGVTYQWVGFSDPGMRYVMNGAVSHKSSDATSVNVLPDTAFLPLGGFFLPEQLSSVATKHFYKGPGHSANNASPLTSAEVASVATLATGSLTTFTNTTNLAIPQCGYSLWRASDGTTATPVAITSYTGNGGGNRTIALTLGGRFPHFALVVPHGNISYFRDPSNTGTISQTVSGLADASNAIRGGAANSLLVGSTLNTNAVVYDVFVIAGDSTGAGSGGWSSNASDPIFTAETITRPSAGPWIPADTRGWWMSTNKFTGSASLVTTPANPKHPRHWDKIAAFATGNAASMGGNAAVVYNNHLVYAGDDYTLSTDSPVVRLYDGLSDRVVATIPTVSGTVAKAIMSMLLVGSDVYLTTLDSGTTSANFTGRVLKLDLLTQNISQVGTTSFSGGNVPYALGWFMNRLWMGTNKSDGTAGSVYWIRPGIDTDWTLDRLLSASSAGGALCMAVYKGDLYVGTDGGAVVAGQVLKRTPLGVWSNSVSGTGAAFQVNNGYYSMMVFGDNLYTGYWNPSPSNIAKVQRFDGTTWSVGYTGVSTTLRPFISLFQTDSTILVVGGGSALAACLASSTDGTTWTDITSFLTGPTTETALPIVGAIGV